ncbi:tRNA (adenosine(37)-N6)-threonylcarbamoyltransferase complex transferase subunit TsaD [Candidatus Shapirobacteria bacterium]|nr:tRNA (adenosine(37)-N6)-threonylcarbamoyltransferase complex transferase subunit TsaD [Candidatus Shapirobacteria bacterium]
MKIKTILSIDTSCDETAAAVTFNRRVLSNVIYSQIKTHQPWGGVVPNLARREHQKKIEPVIKEALQEAKKDWKDIQAIAVTRGPGLSIALEVGLKKAKELSQKYNKPLLAINHMEGHFLSSLALDDQGKGPISKINFPVLGLLVSGGHTQLVLMKEVGKYQLLGQTLDDAAGEAFDKVAKMLGLGYPGGPAISKLAPQGNLLKYNLPIPMARNQSLNFSFSGLKTACFYKLQKIPNKQKKDKQFLADFCASFEKALVCALILKLQIAIRKYSFKQIFLGGGVINNQYLCDQVKKVAKANKIKVFLPYSRGLLTDNAAMIGIAAFYKAQRNEFVRNLDQLDRKPNLCFPEKSFLSG